jgi:hypothetical protein
MISAAVATVFDGSDNFVSESHKIAERARIKQILPARRRNDVRAAARNLTNEKLANSGGLFQSGILALPQKHLT